MYTVWDVTFRIKSDDRGPCDPLYRTQPLTRGSVGDADPFSNAFGKSLTSAEDSLHLRSPRYEQASSVTSETSDFFSLQSSMQDSPFTPNTVHSTFSQSDSHGSTGRQLPYLPVPPKPEYNTRTNDSLAPPSPPAKERHPSHGGNSDLTAMLEADDDSPRPQIAPSSTVTLAAFASKAELLNDTIWNTKPGATRRRKRKAPFSTTRRPPVKTREQHLSDNKAAAAKCRQQRRSWETHLQETSLALKASIDTAKSEINELGNELAALKRQLWACPDCTDRYVYSRGLESSGTPADSNCTGPAHAPSNTSMT